MAGPLHPVMTEAQWDALRTAMLALPDRPRFRVTFLDGRVTDPDAEWAFHFPLRDYRDFLHVDLLTNMHNHADVHHVLMIMHAPGERIGDGFRVIGQVPEGQAVAYIRG